MTPRTTNEAGRSHHILRPDVTRLPTVETMMHIKCIYDLWTLPLDIPPYLHHILVIFMLFDDYWE
jgi:hypothetical protein